MEGAQRSSGIAGAMRRHPVISGTLAGCAGVGMALGLAYLSDDWSMLRRALAGGVAGAGVGFVIVAPKLYG